MRLDRSQHAPQPLKRRGLALRQGLNARPVRRLQIKTLSVGPPPRCAGITPGIKLIPSAVLWGYFAYMAADSLPGSQFWDRILLLFTDPRKRYV